MMTLNLRPSKETDVERRRDRHVNRGEMSVDDDSLECCHSDTDSASSSSDSVSDVFDMICPICEETCSCDGRASVDPTVSSSLNSGVAAARSGASSKNKKKRKGALNSAKTVVSNKKLDNSRNAMSSIDLAMSRRSDRKAASTVSGGSAQRLTARPHQTPRNNKRSLYRDTRDMMLHGSVDLDDYAQQLALSEYYFSESEEDDDDADGQRLRRVCMRIGSDDDDEEENAVDAFAEYYGYSSGTDIAMESLVLADDDPDTEDESAMDMEEDSTDVDELELEYFDDHGSYSITVTPNATSNPQLPNSTGPLNASHDASLMSSNSGDGNSKEQSISEQLAKVTPQILAAISVAAKNIASQQAAGVITPIGGSTIPIHNSISSRMSSSSMASSKTPTASARPSSSSSTLRLDDVMDTDKMSTILSTSPMNLPRRTLSSMSMSFNNNNSSGVPQASGTVQTEYAANAYHYPQHAFYRSGRRGSVNQHQSSAYAADIKAMLMAGALRQGSKANCTLAQGAMYNAQNADLHQVIVGSPMTSGMMSMITAAGDAANSGNQQGGGGANEESLMGAATGQLWWPQIHGSSAVRGSIKSVEFVSDGDNDDDDGEDDDEQVLHFELEIDSDLDQTDDDDEDDNEEESVVSEEEFVQDISMDEDESNESERESWSSEHNSNSKATVTLSPRRSSRHHHVVYR